MTFRFTDEDFKREVIIPAADQEYLASGELPAEESKRQSEAYARQVIESLLPDLESRRVCLNLVADYIIQAHQHSAATWEVTLFPNRVRLNVGNIQTFVIYTGEVYLVMDGRLLTDQDRAALAQQGKSPLETYKTVPNAYDVQLPAQNLLAILPIVQKSYAPLIEEAFKTGKRTPYYRSHSPGVLMYMRSFLDRDIPDPDYGLKVAPPPPASSPSFNLRAVLAQTLTARGLTFTPWQVATFYTALQTKGFVILSGISGTGKTKLAQAFAETLPQPIALLGAADPVKDQTYWTGKPLAYWWSYPIRDDVKNALTTPFHLYIYNKGQVTHAYTVEEVVTQTGSEGLPSPWTEITLPQEVGKTQPDDHPAWKFKTWCKVTQMSELDRPFDLTAVQPLSGYTNHPESLRNALVPIVDPQKPNCLFLAVRPDWRDSKSLLGYYNPLTQTYEWTPFLRFLLHATRNYRTDRPLAWFVILDEMNLAHVEYYFADLLSVLESGRDDDGWTKEPLRLHYPDDAKGDLPPRTLRLPPNLYIVGTVNVDETTHAFSPKVLDRAFTLELTETNFGDYPPLSAPAGLSGADRQHLLIQFTRQERFAQVEKENIAAYVAAHPEVRARLQALNDLLHPHDLHFGYRVFDEIVAYLGEAEHNGLYTDLGGADAAFDAAVLMKVLPKFHGSRGKLERPLQAILAWCVNPEMPDLAQIEDALRTLDVGKTVPVALGDAGLTSSVFRYRRTATRVQRMLTALYTTGFAAFG